MSLTPISNVISFLQKKSFPVTLSTALNRAVVYDSVHSQIIQDYNQYNYIGYLQKLLTFSTAIEGADYSEAFTGSSYYLNFLTATGLSVQSQIHNNFYFNTPLAPEFFNGLQTYFKPDTGFYFNPSSNRTQWTAAKGLMTVFSFSGGNYIGYKNSLAYYWAQDTGTTGGDNGANSNGTQDYFNGCSSFTVFTAFNGNGAVHAWRQTTSPPYNPQTVIYNRTDVGLYVRVIDASGHSIVLQRPLISGDCIFFMQWDGTNKILYSFYNGAKYYKIGSTFTNPSWGSTGGQCYIAGFAYDYGMTNGVFSNGSFNRLLSVQEMNLIGNYFSQTLNISFTNFLDN